MLRGRKKALAVQVLMGLLVASQAYAADYTINAQDGEAGEQPSGNTYTFSNWGDYRFDSDGKPILGGDKGIWLKMKLK